MEVSAEGTTHKKVPFMCAYRTIRVYISGLSSIYDPDAAPPVAGVTEMPAYYTYYLETAVSNALDFEQTTRVITVENEPYFYAEFLVPHFEAENDTEVYIAGNTGTSVFRNMVRLEDFLRDNEISLFAGDELEIPICFKFTNDTFVGIEIPEWSIEHVRPGFGGDDDDGPSAP